MIKNSTRKVYIVNNFKSDKIEQAIFILKSGCEISGRAKNELAIEAQKIIDDYVIKLENEKYLKKNNKKRAKKNSFKYFAIIFSFLAAMGILSYILAVGLLNIF